VYELSEQLIRIGVAWPKCDIPPKHPLIGVRFTNLELFKFHRSVNFLAVPNWLTVKFHYFLIGPKVINLNTIPSLPDLTPFSVS